MSVIKVVQTALRWLFPFSNKHEIEIVDQFHEHCADERMPITVEDVKWYVEQVEKKDPHALKGIKSIILCNMEPQFHPNIRGSYTPTKKGAIIRLYGMAYCSNVDKYTLDFNNREEIKLGFTPVQARDLMLSTLGHEIGHNVEYRRSGRLFGDDVEKFCDQYADELNIVVDPERSGQGKVVYVDDILLSRV
ncbi:hypothetical protein B0I26_12114 [Anoxybacillus vitaminiphilus]|uniref:Uncharacterized protein n=1 Tax=Paranoxybacillus vitaminiphilus TaxID=581036 RepID=A0A327Y3X0_9BACL|nr:hypothetical protein [Anoxybacillus vitaminiphilus]MCG5025165.1 hypothetical protein [Anoxybacillus flavithermus]MCG6175015.1 hypothetical protein [Anoxybacillus sp. LAT_31]RAK15444.1 hypothetical protein B0I26_12114 [Anoxybacillus vitaminiphilus]